MAKSDSSTSRTLLSAVVIWLIALCLMALLKLPLWVEIAVLSLASVFSVGLWKWRQMRLLLDSDHLIDRLRLLSDTELQNALEDVAAFKAALGQPGERASKPLRYLLTLLNDNQLILMKERLQRSGFYDDAPPVMSGVVPIVANYAGENDRSQRLHNDSYCTTNRHKQDK
jgi:hypothetical protein